MLFFVVYTIRVYKAVKLTNHYSHSVMVFIFASTEFISLVSNYPSRSFLKRYSVLFAFKTCNFSHSSNLL